MGFKGYLPWDDAVHGSSDNWINNHNNISKNCTMVANSTVWTVKFFSLL